LVNPPDRWPALPPGYTEWPAPPALRGAVACLWALVTPDDADRDVLVLPDACSDLIWQQGTGAYVAGPDTGPAPVTMSGGTTVVGVRFRPTAGGPVLGVPLHELRDLRVGLADVLPAAGGQLPADLDPGRAAERTLGIAAALIADADLDPAVTEVALALTDPRASTEDATADTGLSPRHLRRRFHDAVGYGPKTLQRILRFRRFVSRIDAGDPADLATLAAETGYADQAHLTRECTRLAGMPPAALVRARAGQ
jgi:AraC-like DNA-binding protein